MTEILADKRVLITGGTGSFGNAFIRRALDTDVRKLIVFSRDELKQFDMQARFIEEYHAGRLAFFLGDVRDQDRLRRAFDGVDIVVHAAALKQIDACSYNPSEAVRTNVLGAMNVIDAAIDCGVQRVIALSTDKACEPTTLYGKTKSVLEGLMATAGAYSGANGTLFACCRYGNVAGSRGSVIPHFKRLLARNQALTITDERMTRFWMRLDQAVEFVLGCLTRMEGGEVFVPKLPAFKVLDLAKAMGANALHITGVRTNEKLAEVMIGREESREARDLGDCFALYKNEGRALDHGFVYDSDENHLTVDELRRELELL